MSNPFEDRFPGGYNNRLFGEAIGCTHSTASRIVNGNRLPSLELVHRISEVFGVPMQELLTARRKGLPSFGELMQRRVVRPANRAGKHAAKVSG